MKPFNFVEKTAKIDRRTYPNVTSINRGRHFDDEEKDFYDFSSGVELSDAEKQRYVDEALDDLNANPENRFSIIASGNVFVAVFRYDDSIEVLLTTKYMEASIPT